MRFIMALSLAILAYIAFEEIFNKIFMKKIIYFDRLKRIENLESLQDDSESDTTSFFYTFSRAFIDRILEIIELIVPRNEKNIEKIATDLKEAGINMSPIRYSAMLIFRMVISSISFFILAGLLGLPFLYRLLGFVLGMYGGYTFSRFSFKRRINKRREEIYHQLPEVMDLLCVSVVAGLGFDQALGYIVERGRGVLIDELDITRKEMLLGLSRKEALMGLAQRCKSNELKTFAAAVIQADEMGASIQNILKIQSETIKDTHRQAVEEKAQKLPVKMLFPLVIFVFPTIFLVLLGPAALAIMNLIG